VLTDLLRRGYEVLALDFPGFGQSDLPSQPWGVPDYAHNLRELLLQIGFYPADIIAHSFGGRVAIVLAATWPEMVRRMVLVASAGIRMQSPRVRLIRALTRTIRIVFGLPGLSLFRRRVQEALNRRFASSDYLQAGALRPTFSRVVGQDLREYAARIKAPTLLVWGELDTETPLAQAKVLESLIPDSGLVVFPGAGHFCYLERFPRFSLIVAEFLKG
jgi:pimeloyl-ACP methyl ester carboxylesterase